MYVILSMEKCLLIQGNINLVVGRQPQIEWVIQILGRRIKNNPCLIGELGVVKIAIAEGLSQRIAYGDVLETIEGKKVRIWLCFSYIYFYFFCVIRFLLV